jgi:hypothetical protein
MNCSNCQAEIRDDSQFCRKCGAPVDNGKRWTEEGILLFSLPNREPKEDGGRKATNPDRRGAIPLGNLIRRWCGVLAVSPASWRLRDR